MSKNYAKSKPKIMNLNPRFDNLVGHFILSPHIYQ